MLKSILKAYGSSSILLWVFSLRLTLICCTLGTEDMDVWKAPTCGLLEGPLFLQSPLAGTGPQQRTLTQGPISSGPQQLRPMEQIS